MGAPALVERLREHLAESRLLAAPGLAVLAVSGGGDSLAMLDLMAGLAGELGLDLLVAHADHGILPDSGAIAAILMGASCPLLWSAIAENATLATNPIVVLRFHPVRMSRLLLASLSESPEAQSPR
jgi:tRNA(Ile)-lysidine synthase